MDLLDFSLLVLSTINTKYPLCVRCPRFVCCDVATGQSIMVRWCTTNMMPRSAAMPWAGGGAAWCFSLHPDQSLLWRRSSQGCGGAVIHVHPTHGLWWWCPCQEVLAARHPTAGALPRPCNMMISVRPPAHLHVREMIFLPVGPKGD